MHAARAHGASQQMVAAIGHPALYTAVGSSNAHAVGPRLDHNRGSSGASAPPGRVDAEPADLFVIMEYLIRQLRLYSRPTAAANCRP